MFWHSERGQCWDDVSKPPRSLGLSLIATAADGCLPNPCSRGTSDGETNFGDFSCSIFLGCGKRRYFSCRPHKTTNTLQLGHTLYRDCLLVAQFLAMARQFPRAKSPIIVSGLPARPRRTKICHLTTFCCESLPNLTCAQLTSGMHKYQLQPKSVFIRYATPKDILRNKLIVP